VPAAESAVVARSRVTDVCSQLSQEIRRDFPVDGGWLPPERELAKRLGVSRTVIREATKRLELQGLIEVQHGVGLKVVDRLHAPLIGALELLLPEKLERLAQLAETRRMVEPELARQAAERATAKHVQQLSRLQWKRGTPSMPISNFTAPLPGPPATVFLNCCWNRWEISVARAAGRPSPPPARCSLTNTTR
jgi:DNA-binding FadR family transcriptional regulator